MSGVPSNSFTIVGIIFALVLLYLTKDFFGVLFLGLTLFLVIHLVKKVFKNPIVIDNNELESLAYKYFFLGLFLSITLTGFGITNLFHPSPIGFIFISFAGYLFHYGYVRLILGQKFWISVGMDLEKNITAFFKSFVLVAILLFITKYLLSIPSGLVEIRGATIYSNDPLWTFIHGWLVVFFGLFAFVTAIELEIQFVLIIDNVMTNLFKIANVFRMK